MSFEDYIKRMFGLSMDGCSDDFKRTMEEGFQAGFRGMQESLNRDILNWGVKKIPSISSKQFPEIKFLFN